MKLLLGTLLFAFGSALLPFLNIEAYLAVVAAETSSFSHWQLAAVGALGQGLGKILWYIGGANSLRMPWMRRKMATEKWQLSYQKWHQRIVGRPVVGGLVCFTSAVSGFPPLAIISVLAGALRMNFTLFAVTMLTGRFFRFWGVLAGVGFLVGTHGG